jgi:hypothetical protein
MMAKTRKTRKQGPRKPKAYERPPLSETRKEIGKERIKRQLEQTAAERYRDHQDDIEVLLDLIQEELRGHAERAAQDSKEWGYAADLGRVRESLKGVLESLLIGRYEWSAGEASRFIEDHLEGTREMRR